MAVGYPSFTAIKESGEADHLVYGSFSGRLKILIVKDSTPVILSCNDSPSH